MLIKELRVADFLVFTGEHIFEIPHTADNNLVVFLAPQNTGKTTIIRCLQFLFYEDFPGNVEDPYELINRKSRDETRAGQELDGWVEATIEHNGEEIILRRTIRSSKRGKDSWSEGDVWLDRVRRSRTTKFEPDEGNFQRMLSSLVPRTLFDAFYFKGEPLDGKLLGGVRQIRRYLSSFLHEDKWEEATQAAAEVRRQYSKELAKLTEKDKEYAKLVQRESDTRDLLNQKKTSLRETSEALTKVKKEFREKSNLLKTLGDPEQLEQLTNTRAQAEAAREVAITELKSIDAEMAGLVGKSHGLPFVAGAVPKAQEVLKQLEETNVLPGGVKDWFVQKILDAGVCVCGREHDEKSRAEWEAHLEKALSKDVDDELTLLQDAIEGKRHNESFSHRSKQLFAVVEKLETAHTAAFEQRRKAESTVAEVKEILQDSPKEQIRDCASAINRLAVKRENLRGEETDLQNSVDQLELNLKRLKAERVKATPKGAKAKKLALLQEGIETAGNLAELLDQSRERLKDSYWRILERLVSEAYDGRATDGSRARIDHDSMMPFIQERGGQKDKNLGGGQSQLLVLAFITGLAKLRKELHSQMQSLGIGLGQLDDQSFFMDSPFDKVDRHYSKAILDFLRTGARQVVILMARQQWDLVKEHVEKDAARVWGFRLHCPPDVMSNVNPKDFIFDVEGKPHNLLEPVGAGEPTYSEPFLIQ